MSMLNTTANRKIHGFPEELKAESVIQQTNLQNELQG